MRCFDLESHEVTVNGSLTSGLIQARKSIPIDRLEHLKCQLSSCTHPELIGQLEEVIAKLEPLDSASSSRRSSISSHVRLHILAEESMYMMKTWLPLSCFVRIGSG